MKTIKFLLWFFIALTYGSSVIWVLIFFVALAGSVIFAAQSSVQIAFAFLFVLAMLGVASLEMERDDILISAPPPIYYGEDHPLIDAPPPTQKRKGKKRTVK